MAENTAAEMKDAPVKILLVEDNPAEARLLRETLAEVPEAAFETRTASRMDEALRLMAEDSFSGILLDLSLPDSQGLETLRRITSAAPTVPVIVLTGLDDEAMADESLRCGAQDYLIKGQTDGRLLERSLRYAIHRKQMLEQLRRAQEELEARVQRRTAELRKTVERLQQEIAQRVHAEDQLRRSKQVLENIFATPHLLLAYMDRDFNFIRVNPAYAQADQRRPEFFPGKNHFQLYPDSDNEQIFREVVRTGQPFFTYEKPFVYAEHPERGVTYWDWSLAPVKNRSGEVEGLILALLDATQRRRAQDALRESEERFRQMAENLPEVLWLAGSDMQRILYVNPAFEKVWARPCREVLDKPGFWVETIHPEDRPAVLAQMQEHLENPKKTFEREFRIVRPDGSARLIRTRAFGVFDQRDRLYRVCGISEDITDKRHAEEASLRLAAIVEASQDAIIGESLDGTITSWSAGAERMFGYKAREIVGKHVSILSPPRRPNEWVQVLQAVARGERVESLDTIRVAKDGTRMAVSLSVCPIRDASNAITGASLIVRDVREYRRLQKEVLGISEMEQKRIGRDLHDTLGQVLTGAGFLCQVLQDKLREKSLAEAKDASHIMELINQSVKLCGSLARGLCPVEISDEGLMAALKELALRVNDQFGVSCRFLCQKPVFLDDVSMASQLYLIAQEAVNNAAKHSRASQIIIEVSQSGDRLTLSVRDDGIGLSEPQDRRKGMGLRIMRYRAGVIGASFHVEAAAGGGTCVICSLEKAAMEEA